MQPRETVPLDEETMKEITQESSMSEHKNLISINVQTSPMEKHPSTPQIGPVLEVEDINVQKFESTESNQNQLIDPEIE